MESPIIYTVGHSTHKLDYFLELLQSQSVNCLVDVRSIAASAYNPQFNKEPLSNFLKRNGVIYTCWHCMSFKKLTILNQRTGCS